MTFVSLMRSPTGTPNSPATSAISTPMAGSSMAPSTPVTSRNMRIRKP